MNAPQTLSRWSQPGSSRVPFWAYTDTQLYRRELEKIFYGPHWCYVGLEVEIPNVGDYRLSWVGERQVILVRDRVAPKDRGTDHGIRVLENRCAHRGVRFCQPPMDGRTGNARSFVCPYHQWTYKLNGELAGLPFKDGVQAVGADGSPCVHGGMPEGFDLKAHGLTRLRVAVLHGLVFATFDPQAEPLEQYLGPQILPWLDRIFQGRQLTLLGYNRQRIPGNWKLMMENIKDPYHPGLLHTWFVTFGLWRADQKSRMVMDAHGRHAVMISRRNPDAPAVAHGGENKAVTQGVTSFKADMALQDARLLDVVPEPWWKVPDPSHPGAEIMPSVTMITLFPSLIIQQQVNSLSTRHIVPRGEGGFDFVWTHFGFEGDTPEMTRRRLRQANLFGPAGFVSADDGEVIELSQEGFRQWGEGGSTLCELGGTGTEPTEHMVTETLIRSMYAYWRKVMNQ
ncbi:aromatic ring-hydroxylating dioxygenase subunit alpha [Ramlibacter tataouinensis]|uniref:Candidate salicylate-5-hydroxylase large oxygenase component n=1 Tax=Ramlibacter tataouinensis (strain ATCC BAA-407 / DSM 14655 / LMG 21543 / TTB310) TaxID=365046 RepID=F5Y3P3_RAMTT|nr:aromatic ring-hydroxylating dioxygenase subunit alpha [Ramlibacter tataouinensis]AEG93700.1 Candidate salicylate-5-hydroxylase large oxygenase component [Ramlibacter tataouinensis TTB310]